MIKKLHLITAVLLLFTYVTNAQSDGCDDLPANELIVDNSCNYVSFDNSSNTFYWQNTGSGSCGESDQHDAWAWFEATSSSTTITYNPTQPGDVILTLFEGACATNMTSVACANNGGSPNPTNEETITYNTTPNTIYRVRVQRAGGNNSINGDICVYNTPTPPANNDCSVAFNLSINSTCIFTQYTNENATDSGVADPGCADYSGGDVWFSVTVPASGGIVIDTDTGVVTDGGMALYSGTCGMLTLIECDDDDSDNGFMPSITATGLNPGDTLYIRFWEYGNNNNGTFDICVTEPPPPPTNIDCASADNITCGQTISATTTGTTGIASGIPTCAMSDYGVWYTFVGDGNQTTIEVTGTGGFDTEMAVMTGSCGALTGLTCQDNVGTESYTFTSIVGQDYYVYVAHYFAGSTTTGDFTISLTCTPPNCTSGTGIGTSPVGLPNLTVGDTSGNNPVNLSCGSSASVDLEASYLELGNPSSYSVSSISYAPPYQFDCLANQFSTFSDDTWSPVVPIGFNFCFYDNNIANVLTQLNMGANGVVTFETNVNPGDPTGWEINTDIPSNVNATEYDFFLNPINYFYGKSIYGTHHDIDPSQGGQIGYELITLDTGERALIMSWHDVAMFDNGNFGDGSKLYTGMIVLYEHSNIIDVFIENKEIDDFSWNDGNAAVAIQNDATTGLAAPNRNSLDTNWTVSNEAWRFTPNGGGLGSISSITWYEGSAIANGGTTSGLTAIGNTNNVTVTPGATTTYTAEVTYNFCDGNTISYNEEVEIVVSSSKTWNGSISTNWYTDGNWTPSGVPTINDCVIIPNTANQPSADIGQVPPPVPPAPGPTLARNVTVLADAILTIDEDTHLVVDEWLNVDSDGIVHIKNSGSLVQVDDNSVNTGNIHMERSPNSDQSAVGNLDYVFWSSPVASFDVDQISPGSNLVYEWESTIAGNGNGNHGDWILANGTMSTAKGYIIRGLSGTPTVIPGTSIGVQNNTALFSGVPQNGIINRTITHGNYNSGPYTGNNGAANGTLDEDDNWNLIGNPYPSAISADLFLDYNANGNPNDIIDGTVWLWPHDSQPENTIPDPFYEDFVFNYGNDYIEYNFMGSNPPEFSSGHIAAGQSFFVLMEHSAITSADVVYNNNMRQLSASYDNGNFLEAIDNSNNERSVNSGEKHRLWLNFSDANNSTITALVGYAENATDEIDKMYDSVQLEGSENSFYSIVNDKKLAIQGKSLPFDEQDQIPLGLTVNQAGSYTIGINTLDGLFLEDLEHIYLEDTELGIYHDLKLNPYTFAVPNGETNDRFILRFTLDTLGLDDNLEEEISILGLKDSIKISATYPFESVAIYDVLGRQIISLEKLNKTEFYINNSSLSNGVYLVKVQLNDNRSVTKKLVIRQ
ncbi:MAG: T9SS sorting signal type C domain-containing protein [bacterium]